MFVNDAEEPLNAMVIVGVVLVALADKTNFKSVYVAGIELKTIVEAPPTPTVVELISSIRHSPHTKQKLNQ
jgi:hypothetical protein